LYAKKVDFNGIELLTAENDAPARSLLGIVESILDHLESDLENDDENFPLSLNMEFTPDQTPSYGYSVTSLSNDGTRAKVMKTLEKSTNTHLNKTAGTISVNL